MSERYWTIDEANRALPHLTELVARARRAWRDRHEDAAARSERIGSNGHRGDGRGDELTAIADELDRDGIVLRDLEQGLVDFPARSSSGRDYWLCWVVGEPAVEWWHWPEDGFAGRTPISDLPE
jgi:hypothetical protein